LNQSIAAALPLSSFGEEPPLNPLSLNGTRIPATVPVTAKSPPPAANASLSTGPVRKKKIVTNILLCLSNGERIAVEAFDEQDDAKERARELTQELQATSDWYLAGTRLIRPDAVVSIDLECGIVR
jgi:hypothetical protein